MFSSLLSPRAFRFGAALAVWCFSTLGLLAEMPVFRLDTVFPPSARLGTELEVAITGADGLDGKELLFSHPGLSAEWKEKDRFKVKVAADVPPGVYEVRASGTLGISNPRSFLVGREEQVVPAKSAASVGEALELKSGVAVVGKATAAASDYFRFHLKQGERALIVCEAAALDSRLAPVLDVLNAKGEKLPMRAVKAASGVTLLDLRAPQEADYVLRLHDLAFAGGAEYAYRLLISQAPFVETASSVVLQAGGRRKVTLFGRQLPQGRQSSIKGLDGVDLEELDVEIDAPPQAQPWGDGRPRTSGFDIDGFSFRLQSPNGASNAIVFGLSTLAPVVEPMAANTNGAAAEKRFEGPAVLSGHFYPKGEVDRWTFEAKKGEVWRLEVLSHRLGLPTNPMLLVQKNGSDIAEAWGPDADMGGLFLPLQTNDPTLRFEAKEDGAYTISVRDLSGMQASNPVTAYALVVRKETPDFRILASVLPPPEITAQVISAPYSAHLRAGGTVAVRVIALRKDGFAGEIDLSAEGLPEGVTCVPTRILAGKNEGYLVLSAQEKVASFRGPIKITGRAQLGGNPEVRQARAAVSRWASTNVNTTPVESYLVKDLVLALVADEASPLALDPAPESVREVAAGGKLEVSLKVARRGEFKEVLKLKTLGVTGSEQVKEVEVGAKADSVKVVLDTAALKLPVGRHTVYFTTLTKGKFRGKDVTSTFFSTPFAFEVK